MEEIPPEEAVEGSVMLEAPDNVGEIWGGDSALRLPLGTTTSFSSSLPFSFSCSFSFSSNFIGLFFGWAAALKAGGPLLFSAIRADDGGGLLLGGTLDWLLVEARIMAACFCCCIRIWYCICI